MNPPVVDLRTRLAALALASLLGGCSTLDDASSGPSYRTAGAPSRSLEVPPDLTQLARDSRYQVHGGVISASDTLASKPATTGEAPAVALDALGGMRVERSGQQRWLVLPMPPEKAWPLLRSFWEKRGLAIEFEDAQAGVLETRWAENRGKLPRDGVRRWLGGLVDRLYDTGERDRFRMRVERLPDGGSEVYVTHRGAEEYQPVGYGESTAWRSRPNDPQLEAEMLSAMMVSLGAREELARPAVAQAVQAPARARIVEGVAALDIDEPFDRAWRRVGLALDRGGFTIEDRDRAAGLYYVRYIDPKAAGKEEPGFFARLRGESNPLQAVRYRVALKAADGRTRATVLTSAGDAEVGDNGRRIAEQLVDDLR